LARGTKNPGTTTRSKGGGKIRCRGGEEQAHNSEALETIRKIMGWFEGEKGKKGRGRFLEEGGQVPDLARGEGEGEKRSDAWEVKRGRCIFTHVGRRLSAFWIQEETFFKVMGGGRSW